MKIMAMLPTREPIVLESITSERAIISAASYYHKVHGEGYRARFDVIEVYLTDTKCGKRVDKVMHLEGTFNKDTAYGRV